MANPYILYSAPQSLYSGKARSFLRKSGLAFEERLVTDPGYMENVMPKTGKFWLPVLQAPDGTIVQDTTEIADYLVEQGAASVTPTSPRRKVVAAIIELFGDEGMLKQAMHYRWNFDDNNMPFIQWEFREWLTPPQFSSEDRDKMAIKAMGSMQKYLPALGISEETIPAIEQGYLDLLDLMNAHLATMPYMLGFEPTIADYGLMGPLYAHLGRDPHPLMIMKARAPRVCRWLERMNASDADIPEYGHITREQEDDFIPPTLLPILKFIAGEYAAEICSIVELTNTYLSENPDIEEGAAVLTEKQRNILPKHSPKVHGMEMPMGARATSLWMLGRVHKAFDCLNEAEQADVNSLLADVGLAELLSARPTRTMERAGCREVWGALI